MLKWKTPNRNKFNFYNSDKIVEMDEHTKETLKYVENVKTMDKLYLDSIVLEYEKNNINKKNKNMTTDYTKDIMDDAKEDNSKSSTIHIYVHNKYDKYDKQDEKNVKTMDKPYLDNIVLEHENKNMTIDYTKGILDDAKKDNSKSSTIHIYVHDKKNVKTVDKPYLDSIVLEYEKNNINKNTTIVKTENIIDNAKGDNSKSTTIHI